MDQPITNQSNPTTPSVNQEPQLTEQAPKKNFPLILVVILFILFAGVVVGKYVLGKKVLPPTTEVVPTVTQPTQTLSPVPDLTADWKTYKSDKYGFEFKYPEKYTIKVEDLCVRNLYCIPNGKTYSVTFHNNPYYNGFFIELKDNANNLPLRDFLNKEILRDKELFLKEGGDGLYNPPDISQVILERDDSSSYETYHFAKSSKSWPSGTFKLMKVKNKIIYFIRLQIYNPEPASTQSEYNADKIIRTFRFTDFTLQSDSEALKAAVWSKIPAGELAGAETNFDSMSFNITQRSDQFTVGKVTISGGKTYNYNWGATKIYDQWIGVYVEKDLPSCEKLVKYGYFPISMVPTCFIDKTNDKGTTTKALIDRVDGKEINQ